MPEKRPRCYECLPGRYNCRSYSPQWCASHYCIDPLKGAQVLGVTSGPFYCRLKNREVTLDVCWECEICYHPPAIVRVLKHR